MMPMTSSSSHNAQQRPAHGPARSGSFLGTLKNIVTAPLNWFSSSDQDYEDNTGKRRRVTQVEDNNVQQPDARSKRLRVDSPEREPQIAYLDPPQSAFQNVASSSQIRPPLPPKSSLAGHHRASSFSLKTNITPYNRRTVSPRPTALQPLGISRTMSMDPPQRRRLAREPKMTSILSRDASMDSPQFTASTTDSRDASVSPARAPFRMRTSLTPQPSRSSFGHPPIIERDYSEPPPLNLLKSNPVFIRGPAESHSRSMSAQPTLTLGSLVDSHRSTRSPVRQHSSLLFGSTTEASNARPGNAAEKALYELDIYKTPLLPTRLQGSTSIPDMFKPPKSLRHLVLTHPEKDGKSRLGKGKGKGREVNQSKPYAGTGGMKKLLARRKMEEEDEKRKEQANAMEDDEGPQSQAAPTAETGSPKSIPKPISTAAPAPFSASAGSRPGGSSLRVGRTKLSRRAGPVERRQNRFSAVYEEDDGDDHMQDATERARERAELEEAAKKTPHFNIPEGFTFAEVPPIQHDLSKAKEPPIVSLPFSFGKPSAQMPTAPPVAAEPKQLQTVPHTFPSTSTTVPSTSTSSAPGASVFAPSISLVPPTPESLHPPLVPTLPSLENKATSSVPNFFASSSIFSKPLTDTAAPTSASPAPMAPVAPVKDSENPLWESEKRSSAPAESKPLFSGFGQPPSQSIFDSNAGGSSLRAPPLPSPFGSINTKADAATTAPLFGTVGKPAETNGVSPAPVFSFSAPPKPTNALPGTLFGNPSAGAEAPSAPHTAPPMANPPSLFGSSNSSTSFGSSASFAPPGPPKSLFSFDQPKSDTPAAATSAPVAPEAPKPLFGFPGGPSFGQPSSATEAKETSKSPFSFGAAPSTPPAAPEKKSTFSFAAPTAISPSVSGSSLFGGPNSSTNASDVSSKPFVFGSAVTPTARPATPPKNDEQEFRMEESPSRDMQLNGIRQDAELKPSLGFGFGNSGNTSSSLFSQPSPSNAAAPSFSFGVPTPNPFAKPEEKAAAGFSFQQSNAPPASNAFSFGKPTENESARSSTGGGFSFAPTPPPAAGTAFPFGGPGNTSSGGLFPPPSSVNASAPNSPSTFAQPTPFSFGSSAPPPINTNTAFSFGSQPASPAPGSATLPTPGGFAFGAPGVSPLAPSQPNSPFGTAAPPGGALFTMGAAPAAPVRQIKKMPNRRVNSGARR